MPKQSKAISSVTPDQMACYVKWLRLKGSKEYQEASEDIRRLRRAQHGAEEHLCGSHDAYRPYLESGAPNSPERETARQAYWEAEEAEKMACEALSAKEDELHKKFGLVQWWDPDDASVTIKDASCIVSPSPPVVILDPEPGKKVDLNAEADNEMRRSLERTGMAVEPPRRYTSADKDGWLTLKVNLNRPLDEVERVIRWLLRKHRWNPPKTRNRPDKIAKALETWVSYEERKCFTEVARHLGRPISTVKGQYVRACVLLFGQRPSGSIKQRRAGIVADPAWQFEAHLGLCNRCQKADSADKFCPKWAAYVNQDSKSLRESLVPATPMP